MKHESHVFEIVFNLLLCVTQFGAPILGVIVDFTLKIHEEIEDETHRHIHNDLGAQTNPELYEGREIKEMLRKDFMINTAGSLLRSTHGARRRRVKVSSSLLTGTQATGKAQATGKNMEAGRLRVPTA